MSRTRLKKLRSSFTAARRKQRLFSSRLQRPPFQLSTKGGSSRQFVVRAGDVVVVGTDGMFVNILEEQLELAVHIGTKLGFSPKNMLDIIAGVTYERSNQTSSKRMRNLR